MRTLSCESVVSQLADAATTRIVRGVIRRLQQMRFEDMPSGPDSGLETIWDEVCVQVQHQHSVMWNLYDEMVREEVAYGEKQLKPHEREAIWLQTPQGFDWQFEEESKRDPYPVSSDDIVHYLASHVFSKASDWRNERIAAYLETAWGSD